MATATELRAKAVDLMTSRKGKNSYTQGGKRTYFFGYPDNKPGNTSQSGYSDCSSAVRAAIKAATGIDIGSNTSAQINNRTKKGIVVHTTNGYFPDESVLLPGDCIYFKGNKSHPLDVGHVEMYIGNGQCCGHGSGTGPKIRNMREYCQSRASSTRRYFMAIRWIKGDDNTAPDEPGTLREGMYDNKDVQLMQKNLISLGYDLGADGADGDFGRKTVDAVKSFQENNNMAATGVADPNTLAKITEQLEGLSDPEESILPSLPVMNAVTIASGSWNVRTGPGTEFASAGVIHGGDRLEKIDLEGWIPVLYNGEVRFIGPKAAGR